ncbi:MAG TPA: hypothetical protein ENJ83_03945 [Rhodospirillales bacterium]|nr:hypothetical protein [Rhodospirillales bacterium]
MGPLLRLLAGLFGGRTLAHLGRRLALLAAAGGLALAGLGFLLSALYLALAAGLGAPLAALFTGLILALVATILFLLAWRMPPPPPVTGEALDALAPLLARGVRSRPVDMLLLALLAGILLEQLGRGRRR